VRGEARKALHLIYRKFRESGGEWPTFDDFNRYVIHYWPPNADAARVVRQIPDKLLYPLRSVGYEPAPDEKLVLTIAGVKYCGGRRCDDITNFLSAVQRLAQKVEHYYPTDGEGSRAMPVTAEQLAAELSLPVVADPSCVGRLIALLKAEGLVHDDDYTGR
jgi:hypothetical protein